MGQIVAITGRGGTGKSVCAANIAAALACLGKKVMLIDCDCGMRTQDLIFGISDDVVYNFYDAVLGDCTLKDATFRTKDGLKIMAAPSNIGIDEIDIDAFKKFVYELKDAYDFVFLDCTASISTALKNIISCADIMLIVCTCDMQSAKAGDRLAEIAEKFNVEKNYLIINKLDIDTNRKNDIINSESIIKIVSVSPVGACPYDSELGSGKIVINNKKSICGKAFNNIALRLIGEKVPVLYVKKKGIFH